MFTGIIETTAEILERTGEGLVLARPKTFTNLEIGASICVSGTCLSIVGFDEEMMAFDIMPETWARTKLGTLHRGDKVNLERSMTADGRFEGHIVQGHIEGVAEVLQNGDDLGGSSSQASQTWVLSVQVPRELMPAIIFKGSIAIDGVSLTVAELEDDICSVALIPHTLEMTTLKSLKPGDKVNIETDMFLRGLHHMMMLRLAGK